VYTSAHMVFTLFTISQSSAISIKDFSNIPLSKLGAVVAHSV